MLNAGLTKEAESEKQKLANLNSNFHIEYDENGNAVLKGSVSKSNITYIWRASEDSCDECQALDGTEYDSLDEIPGEPHPNCQCTREEVRDGDEDGDEDDDEEYNCVQEIEDMISEVDDTISEVESSEAEAEEAIDSLEDIASEISNYPIDDLEEHIEEAEELKSSALSEIQNFICQVWGAIQAFRDSYNQMVELKEYLGYYLDGAAEYYHTKANCESAQLGEVGEATAKILGYAREFSDFPKEILFKGQSVQDAFEHGIYDLRINKEGRELGKQNPNKDPEEIITKPDGLPEEYW